MAPSTTWSSARAQPQIVAPEACTHFPRQLWAHAFCLSARARWKQQQIFLPSWSIDGAPFIEVASHPPSPPKNFFFCPPNSKLVWSDQLWIWWAKNYKLNVNRKCVQLYFGHYLIIVWMNNNNNNYPGIRYIRISVQCFRLPKTRQQYWHYTILHYIYLLVFCTYTLDSYIHQMLPRDL